MIGSIKKNNKRSIRYFKYFLNNMWFYFANFLTLLISYHNREQGEGHLIGFWCYLPKPIRHLICNDKAMYLSGICLAITGNSNKTEPTLQWQYKIFSHYSKTNLLNFYFRHICCTVHYYWYSYKHYTYFSPGVVLASG